MSERVRPERAREVTGFSENLLSGGAPYRHTNCYDPAMPPTIALRSPSCTPWTAESIFFAAAAGIDNTPKDNRSRRLLAALKLIGGVLAIAVGLAQSQTNTAATPRFDVASIKPCEDADFAPASKSGGEGGDFSPGTLRLDCTTVMNLIRGAYVLFANGHVNPRSRVPVEGGPAWINSGRYQIDAKAEGARSQGMMHGPMLQTLLEDRFKLKIHRETREVPAYAMTVAKGGLKLHPFKEGSCTPLDLTIFEQFPPPPFPELPPGQEYCGGIDPNDGARWVATLATMKGPNVTVEARAMSIDDFIKLSLGPRLDRPVVNKTGIKGLFDFHLEYAPDETASGFLRGGDPGSGPGSVPGGAAGSASEDIPAGPSIFTGLQQQLGLRLDPAKGPGEFLVIDHVEKPSGN